MIFLYTRFPFLSYKYTWLFSILLSPGVCSVHIERSVELHVVLGQMLALGSDAVYVVVAHGEGVENELI